MQALWLLSLLFKIILRSGILEQDIFMAIILTPKSKNKLLLKQIYLKSG